MNLIQYLDTRLNHSGLDFEALQELLIRLMSYGVLTRDESQTERDLYDRFVRLEEIVMEALALFGIRVFHDRRFEYVRLYPPGSRTPDADSTDDHAFGGGMRVRLSQHEVALALVLRAQYDKALREGKIDERGYAIEPFEAVSLAMKNWLSRSLPEKATERKRTFQRLRRLRLIDYRDDDDVERSEAWLRIHPMIVDFVSSEAIDALQMSDGGPVSQTEESADATSPESEDVP